MRTEDNNIKDFIVSRKRKVVKRVCCKLLLNNSNRQTPHMLNQEITKEFITKISESGNDPYSVLVLICQENSVSLLNYIKNNYSLKEFSKGLIIACTFGSTEVATQLITDGIDIHLNEDEALHIAVRRGYINIVHLLISYGANVNANNNEPLTIAFQKSNFEMIKLLIKHGANERPLDDFSILSSFIEACRQGNKRFIRFLLQKYNISYFTLERGIEETIKHSSPKRLSTIQFLILLGANINKSITENLKLTLKQRDFHLAKYLIKKNSETALPPSNPLDDIYPNPFVTALISKDYKTIDFLKKNGFSGTHELW
jgi:ankyrin repeat protein